MKPYAKWVDDRHIGNFPIVKDQIKSPYCNANPITQMLLRCWVIIHLWVFDCLLILVWFDLILFLFVKIETFWSVKVYNVD